MRIDGQGYCLLFWFPPVLTGPTLPTCQGLRLAAPGSVSRLRLAGGCINPPKLTWRTNLKSHGSSRKQSHCSFICDFYHLMSSSSFFLASLPAPWEKQGSSSPSSFILALPPSQVFIITYFLLGLWVWWHEPHPPTQGEEDAGRSVRMFPSPPLSAGMLSAPWAVIYCLSISKSPWGAERSPAFPHFDWSWVLELAETEVSSWGDSVLFQGGPGFCQP